MSKRRKRNRQRYQAAQKNLERKPVVRKASSPSWARKAASVIRSQKHRHTASEVYHLVVRNGHINFADDLAQKVFH